MVVVGGVRGGGGTSFDPGFRKQRAYTKSISCLRKQPFETHLLAAPSGTIGDASEGRGRSDQEASGRLPLSEIWWMESLNLNIKTYEPNGGNSPQKPPHTHTHPPLMCSGLELKGQKPDDPHTLTSCVLHVCHTNRRK